MDRLNQKCWYLVNIAGFKGDMVRVRGSLFDDTAFEIYVHKHLVDPVVDNPKQGWLQVDFNGEAGGRSAISLPAPILDKGHEISVSNKLLNFNKK